MFWPLLPRYHVTLPSSFCARHFGIGCTGTCRLFLTVVFVMLRASSSLQIYGSLCADQIESSTPPYPGNLNLIQKAVAWEGWGNWTVSRCCRTHMVLWRSDDKISLLWANGLWKGGYKSFVVKKIIMIVQESLLKSVLICKYRLNIYSLVKLSVLIASSQRVEWRSILS